MKYNFEYKGDWYLPGSKQRLNGTLTYNPIDGAVLELYGTFNSNFEFKTQDIILGNASIGKITIVDAYFKGTKVSGIGPEISRYLPLYIFIGEHFETDSQIEFEEMFATVFNQFDWYGLSGLSKKIDSKQRTYNLHYNKLEPLEFVVEGQFVGKISLDSSLDFNTNNSKIEIEEECYLTLEYQKRRHYSDVIKDLTKYVHFISFMAYEQSYPESIVFVQKHVKHGKGRLVKCIYRNSNYKKKSKPRHSFQFIVKYNEISDKYTDIMALWYAAFGKFEASLLLLLKSLESSNQFGRDKFMDAARAIESYHRETVQSTRLPKEKYDILVSKILSDVELSKENLEWLTYRLMGNEPSLNTRIRELINKCQNEFISKYIQKPNKFSRQITDTRNYFTHFDNSLRKRAVEHRDLVRAILNLQGLMYSCVLIELGVSPDKYESQLNYYLQ